MSAILLETLGETRHHHGSLACFEQYKEEEKTSLQSSVGRDGRLRDYEALELRINPTKIEIDNESDEEVSRILLDSANRPGTLVEVCLFIKLFHCITGWACSSGPVACCHALCNVSAHGPPAFRRGCPTETKYGVLS